MVANSEHMLVKKNGKVCNKNVTKKQCNMWHTVRFKLCNRVKVCCGAELATKPPVCENHEDDGTHKETAEHIPLGIQ